MRLARLVLLCIGSFLVSLPLVAQQAVQRDAQALTVLSQYVQASGGLQTVTATQDYTESGNVTFNWAGKQVQGTVVTKGRGATQFRMDSQTAEGNETWLVDGLSGTVVTVDGRTHNLAPYNLKNAGSLTLPVIRIAAALSNPTTSIRYMGQVTENSHLAYQIRLTPPVEKGLAVISRLDGPGIIDLFLDSTTYQLIAEVETFHGDRNVTQTYSEEIDFSNYQATNGVLVPLTVMEKVSGQQTWSITLGNVTFNTGLSDADFATTAQ